MSRLSMTAVALATAVLASAGRSQTGPIAPAKGETHFASIRQLTYGGENAEAYFAPDGRWITFQSTRDGRACDQQYIMQVDGGGLSRVSDGTGKTTCGYFIDNGKRLLYASTHATEKECPPRPDPSHGYVWGLDPFDIYTSDLDGKNRKALTKFGVYTAETTVSPDGKTIVFTSLKDGDLDIYTMNIDGTNIRRLTTAPGYDGGAFFSPDGKRIVYRAWHPTGDSLKAYQDLLAQRLVRPNRMEIWTMNADGTDQRQITNLGGANFAPFYMPDGKKIIFSSNYKDPHSGNFDLYLINVDGTGLEQITTADTFDGFPMFSPDGKHLIWASNRHSPISHGTDLYVAEWKP